MALSKQVRELPRYNNGLIIIIIIIIIIILKQKKKRIVYIYHYNLCPIYTHTLESYVIFYEHNEEFQVKKI